MYVCFLAGPQQPCKINFSIMSWGHSQVRPFSACGLMHHVYILHNSICQNFFWYLLAFTCKLLFTMISFNPWHHLSFSIGWNFMLQQDRLYRPSLFLIRAVPYLCFYDAWIFSPRQTNGGYYSMHLNNDIVDVLNTSIAAILPALTQQLLMRWTS